MSRLYTITALVSAGLLFLVQPMFARMALPLFGGSPAVWNTAVLFYQAALLLGYLYAHLSSRWLGARRQGALHLALLLLPWLVLPIAIPGGARPPAEGSPIPWLLGLLLVRVAPPFVLLGATSPLLQRWLAGLQHPAADPYFLYAASNAGSLVPLVAYPLLVEPHLRLAAQSRLWAAGYGLFVALMAACAAAVWRRPQKHEPATRARARARERRLTTSRRARWVFLAAVPASLMLGVTTHLSTSVAPFPLLWVVPLGLYLVTFVLAFGRQPLAPQGVAVAALPSLLMPLVITLCLWATEPAWLLVPLHLVTFAVAALLCHGVLAQDRPGPQHLTEFYLWLALGGALGGAFNALLAPLLFTGTSEYPLALVLAALALWRPGQRVRWLDLGLPVGLGAAMIALGVGLRAALASRPQVVPVLVCGVAGLVCFAFSRRPLRFALAIGVMLLIGRSLAGDPRTVLHAERSFFGTSHVLLDREAELHLLYHGGTLHGAQSLDPARRCEPLAYYHTESPIGQVFASLMIGGKERIAVVGLGTGSLAGYGRGGQEWTFYEIDPAVARIAMDGRYFTYLGGCAPAARVVLGDARLSLGRAPAGAYDLIVLDAYSAEAIPIHLITREALALYLDKLAPQGLVAFHISNRHLDLRPVLADLAQDAGLVALGQDGGAVPAPEGRGKSPSRWVLLARSPVAFGALASDGRWQPLAGSPGRRPWSDDLASVASVLRW